MGERVASAVWRITPDLVLALDEHLGAPVDSYVNGSQTWLTEDGPGEVTLEWRLHPVGGYRPPAGLSHYDLWEQVVAQLAGGRDPGTLAVGDERRPLASLWDGLEVYPPYDDVEPATLASSAATALGRPPDAAGLVDHSRIGDAWERAKGDVSIVALLLDELRA
ncbi:MAG: hypothetical protein ACRDY4_08985 [Acidimicrobiia bacterium]